MPLHESTTDQLPLGTAKYKPSRYTGTPDSLSAATVKPAVHSVMTGTSESPNGTAKDNHASGKASARHHAVPSMHAIVAGTIATTASCAGRCDTVRSATHQHSPSTHSSGSARHDGRIGSRASSV